MSGDLRGWIGVDLDGTLAHYDHWRGADHIGAPVPAMVDRVRAWLADGKRVKVFTARACDADAIPPVQDWCLAHLGVRLEVTHEKDYAMVCLYDDRCVQVETNTGRLVA